MTRDYLNRTRSIEELDALIEQDRAVAAKAAAVLFQHEIGLAVSHIREIQQVAQARILADSQVASATIMSDAEVKAAQLLADARTAKYRAILGDYDVTHGRRGVDAELDGIKDAAAEELSATAHEAIEEIERMAEEAICKLKATTAEAIRQITALSDDATSRVEHSAQRACEKLDEAKRDDREPAEVVDEAEAAANLVLAEAKKASMDLKQMMEGFIGELNTVTDRAADDIRQSAATARKRMDDLLAKALSLLAADQ